MTPFSLTDEELAKELLPDRPVDHAIRSVRRLSEKERATYVNMIRVAREIETGIIPEGVMVDFPRKRKRPR